MLFISKPEADNFARNYLNYMPECTRYIGRDMEDIRSLMADEKDIIWLEWANDLTANITQYNYETSAKVMVRIHDHEITQNRIHGVNWDNVDYIWFINRQAQEDFNKKLSVNCEQFFLSNAVDTQGYTPNYVTNKHIGLHCIYAKPRKRIDRAIQALKELYAQDQEWELTIRVDPFGFTAEYDQYRKLSGGLPIHWDIHTIDLATYGNDKSQINEFYQDKSVVLSTSDHEGFHYAIAEGIACGCYPVVYNWEWGYPRDFWKDHVTDDLVGTLKRFAENTPEDRIAMTKGAHSLLDCSLNPDELIPRLYKKIGYKKKDD